MKIFHKFLSFTPLHRMLRHGMHDRHMGEGEEERPSAITIWYERLSGVCWVTFQVMYLQALLPPSSVSRHLERSSSVPMAVV